MPFTAPPAVFVALGANLGDPAAQVRAALVELTVLAAGPVRASSLWISTPVDCPPDSPTFINAVAHFTPRPGETPETLLERLQTLETTLGRLPKQRINEARPLDLDLIAWGTERRESARLVLPHPRATERRFVLAPLAELAPDFILPGQRDTVAELLARAPEDPGLRRIEPGLELAPRCLPGQGSRGETTR